VPFVAHRRRRFAGTPFLDHGRIKDHDLTFQFAHEFIAKTIAAFEDKPLNVLARSQVGERFLDYGPAVQQALIFRRVHANRF
jgi:hypothetical protein